jgi:hypothetical protein
MRGALLTVVTENRKNMTDSFISKCDAKCVLCYGR